MSELLLGAEAPEAGAAQQDGDEEWPFTVERIPLASLIVDRRYQRPVEERFVTRMTEDFDETLVGAIDVSDRGNDVYAILDGQQRWEVMKRVGKATAYAATFTDMAIEDEAGFFFRKNKDRRVMQGYYGFRARVVAGDLGAVAVQDAVEAEGFTLGAKTDHELVIGSVSAVEQAWGYSSEHRDDSLSPTLVTIRDNWRGLNGSLQSAVILALATFWRRYSDEEVDQDTLKAALAFISTPTNLIERGRQKRSQKFPLANAMAEELVETYNRRREGPVLPPLRPS